MIREQRYKEILKIVEKEEIISVDKLSTSLNIPLTSLRRYLKELEFRHKIIKTHGEVRSNKTSLIVEDYLDNKLIINVQAKQLIALKALKKIRPRTCIFLDSGSTAYYLAKILNPDLRLKIVTNSFLNVQELAKNDHKDIYLIGGKYDPVTSSILGYQAINDLKNYAFDASFIGINAIDDENNIYTTSDEHAQLKIQVIKNSNIAYGLVDKSKKHSRSFYKFASTSDLELIES
ncbi:Glucitol operon repressor [Mycoplasma feriruminatoris]|uniref:DeoR/GlpR family DNA-binding transcription regulator n=1 Tax=Mycoplasma feriruminatoris TaxID=1179777 RepID=UPI00241C59B6|nr:DeoR/GlpR family DNA-binding transcription regulator [Mycoplasma feriruminatoris]WFQ91506.1 Glucitol operon repressor [Mycoplasma feriruminatoris]